MTEIIKKDSFEISIDMETGEVFIRTIDYHPYPEVLNIDVELAEKILAAAQRRVQYLATPAPVPGGETKIALLIKFLRSKGIFGT